MIFFSLGIFSLDFFSLVSFFFSFIILVLCHLAQILGAWAILAVGISRLGSIWQWAVAESGHILYVALLNLVEGNVAP